MEKRGKRVGKIEWKRGRESTTLFDKLRAKKGAVLVSKKGEKRAANVKRKKKEKVESEKKEEQKNQRKKKEKEKFVFYFIFYALVFFFDSRMENDVSFHYFLYLIVHEMPMFFLIFHQ